MLNKSTAAPADRSAAPFAGFALPTSNTTYTPNQFFDVCLPHQSRGVVRLVGYLIRKTLGWCDEHGNPQNEVIGVSYLELERKAGLSHSMIRLALDQAEQSGFIRCVRKGVASSRSQSGSSAAYELMWDERDRYIKGPADFRGFFAGEGNRTYIPNQFFDVLVPNESLAMIQVVGAIIRFSIGFQNKFGHRRQRVALSYRDIQRYTKIASPGVLSKTIRDAIDRSYIERVEAGYFDPNGGALSRSAHYAVKWAQPIAHLSPAPKSEAEEISAENHSENRSGTTPKTEAATHSENLSDIQIKQRNKTSKQQEETAVAFEKLLEIGFDRPAALVIAAGFPVERILQQIDWLPMRTVKSNRLGLLRASIEQNWSAPQPKLGAPNSRRQSSGSFEQALAAVESRFREQINPTAS